MTSPPVQWPVGTVWTDREGLGISVPPPNLKPADIEYLITQAERVVDAAWESMDRLATRASTILGVAITIIAGVTILGSAQHTALPAWTFGVSGLGLLVSAILAMGAYIVTPFDYPPNIITVGTTIVSQPKWDPRWDIFVSLVRASSANAPKLSRKRWLVDASLVVFAVTLSFLLVATAWALV